MKDTVIVISKPWLGTVGPEDSAFGTEMLEKFLHSLEKHERPQALVFMTDGVLAAARQGPFALSLGLLQGMGVRLFCCRTCLGHHGLPDDQVLGEVVGMDRIIEVLSRAPKILNA